MVRIQPFAFLKSAVTALVVVTLLSASAPAQATRPVRAKSVPEIDGTTARAALTLLFLGTLILIPVRRAVRPASDEA